MKLPNGLVSNSECHICHNWKETSEIREIQRASFQLRRRLSNIDEFLRSQYDQTRSRTKVSSVWGVNSVLAAKIMQL